MHENNNNTCRGRFSHKDFQWARKLVRHCCIPNSVREMCCVRYLQRISAFDFGWPEHLSYIWANSKDRNCLRWTRFYLIWGQPHENLFMVAKSSAHFKSRWHFCSPKCLSSIQGSTYRKVYSTCLGRHSTCLGDNSTAESFKPKLTLPDSSWRIIQISNFTWFERKCFTL